MVRQENSVFMGKACQGLPLVLSGCAGWGQIRASVGRVLCKMLLLQKEEHFPHIAAKSCKTFWDFWGFFSVFTDAALEHVPDVLGLHSEQLHSPSAFAGESCGSGETFFCLLPPLFAHPSLSLPTSWA